MGGAPQPGQSPSLAGGGTCQAQTGDLGVMAATGTDKGGLVLPNVAQDTSF